MSESFIAAVRHNLEGCKAFSVGSCPGCDACGLGDEPTEREIESAEESSFSWSDCDSCGSSLGGDRHPAHFLYRGEIQHLTVCVDCLLFHANGDLPEDWRAS